MEDALLYIKETRILRKFTKKHMAESLQISPRTYSKIESGQSKLTFEKLLIIMMVLDDDFNNIIVAENRRAQIEIARANRISTLGSKKKD